MTVSISTCPSCNSTVLPDTVQCPHCNHIILDDVAETSTPLAPVVKTASSENSGNKGLISDETIEQICPSCNEQVRVGLVRCWNCGTFMRDDIAAKYCELQANPAPIIYSEPPNEIANKDLLDTGEMHLVDENEEDGFEIADDVQMIQGQPEDIKTEETNTVETEESYGVQDSAADGSASTETAEDKEGSQTLEDPDEESASEDKPSDPEGESKSPETSEAETSGTKTSKAEITGEESLEGGDDAPVEETLLDVAIKEEKERTKLIQKKKREASSGFLVFCPNGHRIEVQDKHRGKSGKCPKCSSPFTVPQKQWEAPPKDEAPPVQDGQPAEAAPAKVKTVAGDYQKWMEDLHLHVVDPTRLKLKADSLKSAFSTIDLGMAPENVILVDYNLKAGMFGVTDKDKLKKKEARDAVWEHISDKKYINDLPAKNHHVFKAEEITECRVVFPAPKNQDSMFAGIPVFGKGKIAVRIPPRAEGKELEFISFSLSIFREFSQNLNELYEINDLGEDCGLPLTDQFDEATCHYSDAKFKYLPDDTYYQGDPGFDVIIVGRRCANCGLEISEDARKKEKIGGANGKGIAKAKCPKCKAKFGSTTLYSLANADEIIQRAEMENSESGEGSDEASDAPEVPSAE